MLSCKFLSFLLVFRIAKKYHQDFSLLYTIILIIHFFGEKWFTLSVLSPISIVQSIKSDHRPILTSGFVMRIFNLK